MLFITVTPFAPKDYGNKAEEESRKKNNEEKKECFPIGHRTVDVDPGTRRIIKSEITLTVITGPYTIK